MTRPLAVSEDGGCVVRYGAPCQRPKTVQTSDGAWRCAMHAKAYHEEHERLLIKEKERELVRQELSQSFIRVGDGPERCLVDLLDE